MCMRVALCGQESWGGRTAWRFFGICLKDIGMFSVVWQSFLSCSRRTCLVFAYLAVSVSTTGTVT